MNKTQELKERIYKHCPELKELSFGCYVIIDEFNGPELVTANVVGYGDKTTTINTDRYRGLGVIHIKEILGHPIRLEHVLRAMNKCNQGTHYFRIDGVFFEWNGFAVGGTGNHKVKSTYIEYDLTKSFDQNCENPELVDFLLEVIK